MMASRRRGTAACLPGRDPFFPGPSGRSPAFAFMAAANERPVGHEHTAVLWGHGGQCHS